MKNKTKKYVRFRHKVFNNLIKPILFVYTKCNWHFSNLDKYKIKKDEQVFVLSNHQTDVDFAFISLAFNEPLNIVCTDSLTSSSFYKLVDFCFSPIPIKKGASDFKAVLAMLNTVKQGGNILLFPEGNRTYGEFQYPVGDGLIKLIRKLNITLVLYNLIGGTGVRPRFSFKKRKGKFIGKIKRVIKKEEYSLMSDEELHNVIMENLKVYDSESESKYISKRSAEYLERMLFVCPKCNKDSTLISKGEYVTCSCCGLKVKYTESMKFESDDPSFKFKITNDWYQYQKKWVKDYMIRPNEIIFKDNQCTLFLSNNNKKRKKLSEGFIKLTDKELNFNDKIIIPLKDIANASAISGKNFNFSTLDGNTYLVKGSQRFNPLKYVFMFNKLDTFMKDKKVDIYYTID